MTQFTELTGFKKCVDGKSILGRFRHDFLSLHEAKEVLLGSSKLPIALYKTGLLRADCGCIEEVDDASVTTLPPTDSAVGVLGVIMGGGNGRPVAESSSGEHRGATGVCRVEGGVAIPLLSFSVWWRSVPYGIAQASEYVQEAVGSSTP